MVSAQQASNAEVEDIRSAFLALDVCGDGSLSKSAFVAGFASCDQNLTEDELEAVFSSLDVDRNTRVSWAEWLSATLPPDLVASEVAARELFNFYDADGNRTISQGELCRVVGQEEAERVLLHSSRKGNLGWEDFQGLVKDVADERRSSCGRPPRACSEGWAAGRCAGGAGASAPRRASRQWASV